MTKLVKQMKETEWKLKIMSYFKIIEEEMRGCQFVHQGYKDRENINVSPKLVIPFLFHKESHFKEERKVVISGGP